MCWTVLSLKLFWKFFGEVRARCLGPELGISGARFFFSCRSPPQKSLVPKVNEFQSSASSCRTLLRPIRESSNFFIFFFGLAGSGRANARFHLKCAKLYRNVWVLIPTSEFCRRRLRGQKWPHWSLDPQGIPSPLFGSAWWLLIGRTISDSRL